MSLSLNSYNDIFPLDSFKGFSMSMHGSVRFDNKSKTYFVDITWQGDRLRIYKYLNRLPCKTRDIADRLLVDIRSEIDKGIFNPARHKKDKPLHLEQYALSWLNKVKETVSYATWHDYKGSLKNHIIPNLGKEYIPDINYKKLRYLQDNINRTPKGKYNVMGCLHKMLKDAFLNNDISVMPQFPGFKGKEAIILPRINWIDDADQWKIVNALDQRDIPIFLFMKFTGCRVSEARAFQWQDVKEKHIVIERSFGRDEKLKEVKGKRIRLFPRTEALNYVLSIVERDISTPFMFVNFRTNKTYSKSISEIWHTACKKAGVQHIELYSSMRHSFGCQMLNAGLDKSMVQRLLGHTDGRMTDRYAEYSDNALKIALDNVIKLPVGSKAQGSKSAVKRS
jgi:integrase